MTNARVHLEDVARAARLGFALSISGSLVALAVMVLAGVAPVLAISAAVVLAAIGCASGGFGLIARVSLRAPRLPVRDSESVASVPPIRVPQPR